MRSGTARLLIAAVSATLVTACTSSHGPPVPPEQPPATRPAPASYDDSLQPAAAVMALVPSEATSLVVTDYDRVRADLDDSELTGESSPGERASFWRRAERTAPLLTTGLLRPDEQQLEKRFGFNQADVAWEAVFDTDAGQGWVLRLRDDLDLTKVKQALDAGVGSLKGGTLDKRHHLVSAGTTTDPAESWAAEPALVGLVGAPASATYVATDCLSFETAFGSDVEGDLAPAPAAVMKRLEPLGSYAISFGARLGTARLGGPRGDLFERARLAEVMPATDPAFGRGYADPVADPSTGRIGYRVDDPALAARLALARHLPFAVCDG